MKKMFRLLLVTALGFALLTPSALAQDDSSDIDDPGNGGGALDITHGDDVIVEGRICSSDADNCVDGENFNSFGVSGFQLEYKAKDNSPAIGFETTSTSAADWVIGSNGADELRFEWDQGDGSVGRPLTLDVANRVGVNQLIPLAPLHVVGDQSVAAAVESVLIVQSAASPQQIFQKAGGARWYFAMTSDDQFKISRDGTGEVEAKFFENGNLALAGTLIQGSDANNKSGFEAIDGASILDTITHMPITEWNYIDDDARHVGPTAQDFAAAFGLGDTDTGIAAVDADGVALAAIQALALENDTLHAELDSLAGATSRGSSTNLIALIIAVMALAITARNTIVPRSQTVTA